MESLLWISWGVILLYAVIWFLISLVLKRNDFADVAWWLWFITLCCVYFFLTDWGERAYLVYWLILAWWLRLSVSIFLKNRKKPEDFRYAQWRKDWWKFFYVRSFFQVYLLQGLIMWVVLLPVMFISSSEPTSLGSLDVLGVVLWVTWFLFEVVADWQLKKFKQDPKNSWKIMDQGVWKYSRHPNYFWEALLWRGIFVISFSVPGSFYGIISPLLITYLLRYVSWVPLLEKRMEWRLGFDVYKKKTSVFVPLPSKKIV